MNAVAALAERRIIEGRKAGLFDNLDGTGQPIADLDIARPAGWWAVRFARAELRRDQVRDDLGWPPSR